MKIHIVQKGDTLWELAKKYGVDFEELKKVNSQLSSPDMIMPGMKIKIPSTSKPVKKEHHVPKEGKKHLAKHPYKDTSPKPKPVVKEDDMEKPKEIKPKMPMQPAMPMQPMMQMPSMDQEMTNYTTINFPEMPYAPQPMEKPKQEKMPQPQHYPMYQQPMPMQPVYCCCCQCCCPPEHHVMPMHHQMPENDCGCGGPQPMQQSPWYQPMMEPMESPGMEMPMKPAHNPYMPEYQHNMPAYPMGMQQGFYPQNTPPQSHPQFNHSPYPMPPGYGPNYMQPHREDEEGQNEE